MKRRRLPADPTPAVFYSPTLNTIPTGFPSPALDYMEQSIDLNQELIEHPAATFFMRIEGDAMKEASLPHRALVMIDRALTARHGSIVVAVVNGAFCTRRLEKKGGRVRLHAASSKYAPIELTADTEQVIWGVVRHIIIDAKTL